MIEFLTWLADSTPYRIGRSVPLEPFDAADDEDEADLRTTHTGRLVLAIGRLLKTVHDVEHFTEVDPHGRVLHGLLCRWLGVDPAALERERRALLADQHRSGSVPEGLVSDGAADRV